MDVTGISSMSDRGVDELSGGELQRVWLACCLAQQTGVLLLDEPTNHLELRYQVEILDLVRELADEHDVAVGVVLHDLNQALDLADTVALMHDGQVLAVGSPVEVLTTDRVATAYGIRVTVISGLSLRMTKPADSVVYGRLFGCSAFGLFGSSVNRLPRLCSTKP